MLSSSWNKGRSSVEDCKYTEQPVSNWNSFLVWFEKRFLVYSQKTEIYVILFGVSWVNGIFPVPLNFWWPLQLVLVQHLFHLDFYISWANERKTFLKMEKKAKKRGSKCSDAFLYIFYFLKIVSLSHILLLEYQNVTKFLFSS